MTSDQQKQQTKLIYIKRWIKVFGRMQNFWTASMQHYRYYFHSFCLFLLYSVFFLCDFPQIKFFKITLHTDNRRRRTETLASASTAMTSSRKYWYQARSSTAERKWGAPLCRITYSVQYTACSIGVSGWSRMIWEIRWAFSRYLWQPPNIIVQNMKYYLLTKQAVHTTL